MVTFASHEEASATLRAPAAVAFDYLDDPARLGAHMGKSSWRMAGASMTYRFDAARGRAMGSRIELAGAILGLRLFVAEVVTVHEPPLRKAWQTVGEPRLAVIGPYRMGFALEPQGASCRLTVSLDWDPPSGWLAHTASAVFGRSYARWCVRTMAADAARRFAD